MGLVYVDMNVSAPGQPARSVRFLIDSGAAYSLLPREVWKDLKLKPKRTLEFTLADGTTIERKVSECRFEFGGIDATSPVIAKLAVGDRVDAIDGLTRIVPRRGIVRIANQGLEPGDVVYLLDSEGEGAFTLWRRGEQRSWTWPSEQEREADIQWDPQAPDGPALGWWVNVRLADGKTGWVRNPRDFGCMGGLSGDEEGC